MKILTVFQVVFINFIKSCLFFVCLFFLTAGRCSNARYLVFQDREPKMHAGHHRGGIDEEFSGRIKSMEDKLKGTTPSEKKPKDLLRAIGICHQIL